MAPGRKCRVMYRDFRREKENNKVDLFAAHAGERVALLARDVPQQSMI